MSVKSITRRTRVRRTLAAIVVAGAAVASAGSCSDPPEAARPPKDGGTGGTGAAGGAGMGGALGGSGGGSGAGGNDAGAGGSACPAAKPPDDVPAGWIRYPIFDCKYAIYVPPSAAELPAPLSWEECEEAGPDPYTCRELVVDWPTNPGWAIGGGSYGYVDEHGKVVLQLRKSYVKDGPQGPNAYYGVMAVVTEADGPVRQAYWITAQLLSTFPLWFGPRGVGGRKSSWTVLEQVGGSFVRRAAVAGADTDLMQPIMGDWGKDEKAAAVLPGGKYYGWFNGTLSIRSWDGSEDFGTVYAGGMDVGDPIWVGESAVMQATLIAYSHLLSWTPTDGLRKLLHYDNDTAEAAANIATDGTYLVWVHGKDREPGMDAYPTAELVTSPFTTDPAMLEPKRVRSYPSGKIWGNNNKVGCGYAAYGFVPQSNDFRVLIARLSDGVSWELQSPADNHWTWSQPLAITCDELFITVAIKGAGATIRRVRLDSLGPGLPPD